MDTPKIKKRNIVTFYLASQDKNLKVIDCFVVHVNICRGSCMNLDDEIKKSKRAVGFSITAYDEEETKEWLNTWDEDMLISDEYPQIAISYFHNMIKIFSKKYLYCHNVFYRCYKLYKYVLNFVTVTYDNKSFTYL